MIDYNDDPFDLFSRPDVNTKPKASVKKEPAPIENTIEETPPTPEKEPEKPKTLEYSVSEISNKLKNMVESNFSYVKVRGEFSRVTVAKSGHLYTSLKDDKAVLDAICWKGTLSRLSIKPEEGLEVICTGRLTTYPGRSNYQMIIENTEIAGEGALLKMLEERKKKLAAEGLFDESRKKSIPFIPSKIGVITSPTGAVIRDIMHRLNERFPRNVMLYPAMVQGEGAAKTITEAVKKFNSIPKDSGDRPDVLIIARGGGSLEDLMPFNDEELVRAVAASEIPTISAVGHETDTTLIDYAADLRAPTPTAAAEKAVPVKSDLITLVMNKSSRIFAITNHLVKQKSAMLQGLSRGISSPNRLLENSIQRLDYASLRLDAGLKNWLENKKSSLNNASAKLSTQNIKLKLDSHSKILDSYSHKLSLLSRNLLENRKNKLDNLSSILKSCSFERVLERGYSVVFDEENNIISSTKDITANKGLKLRMKDGEVKVEAK